MGGDLPELQMAPEEGLGVDPEVAGFDSNVFIVLVSV